MLVRDFDEFLATKCGYLRFKEGKNYYVIPDIKNAIYQDKTVIIMMRKMDGYNDICKLGNNIELTRPDIQECNILLYDGFMLYELIKLTEEDGCYVGELRSFCGNLVFEDCVTLSEISKHAKSFGLRYCNVDFNDVPIIAKVDGVTIGLNSKDVHFIIDEGKSEGVQYSVLLDIKTK